MYFAVSRPPDHSIPASPLTQGTRAQGIDAMVTEWEGLPVLVYLDSAALAPTVVPQGQGSVAPNIPAASSCNPVRSRSSGSPGIHRMQRQPTNSGTASGCKGLQSGASPGRSQGLNNAGKCDGPCAAVSQGYVLAACSVLRQMPAGLVYSGGQLNLQ